MSSTNEIDALIEEIRSIGGRDEEMSLYFFPACVSRSAGEWGPEEHRPDTWRASFSNPTGSVLIGETNAIYEFEAPTIVGALKGLLDEIVQSLASDRREDR